MTVLLILLTCFTLHGQWLDYSSPGTPRTREGKPNLKAQAPRLGSKPDLNGVWQVKGEPDAVYPEVTFVLGDDLRAFSRYFFNFLDDFPPTQLPITPEGLAVMRNRPNGFIPPTVSCLPIGVPRADLAGFPFKIVQTPQQLVVMYEADHTHRQVYLDGRKLPVDPNPAWLGYSVGRWEGDTLVVDSSGFNDQFFIDAAGHPHSEQMRVQERFRRIDFGHMELQITITDPKMYTQPITFKVMELLLPDTDVVESFCNENEKDRGHMQ